MKNRLFLFIGLIFIIGCQQSEIITESGEFNGISILKNGHLGENVDGYVALEFNEYFDDKAENIATIFAGIFKDEDRRINAGSVIVSETLSLNQTIDNRLLLYPRVNKNDFLGKPISILFDSNLSQFSDFEEDIYVPTQLNVKSNIGKGDYFDKSKDLKLEWTPDENVEQAYIAICSGGVPCVIKELPNTGLAVILSTEFSAFKNESKVVVHLGTGMYTCMDNEGKKVCIAAVNNARTSGHIVR